MTRATSLLQVTRSVPDTRPSARVARIADDEHEVRHLIERLRAIAAAGLPLMYQHDRGQFAFTRRRVDRGIRLEGVSARYTSIVLLGSLGLNEASQRGLLCGESSIEFSERLMRGEDSSQNVGDAALLAWAATALKAPSAKLAMERLERHQAEDQRRYTVEMAWTLSACVAAGSVGPRSTGESAAMKLLAAAGTQGLFPRFVSASGAADWRSHVGCFADQVYSIQALSRYAAVTGDERCLNAAQRCADRICQLQGSDGQWWWHYDVRTGGVVERYPVYSVHQNSMAPMALMDLAEAGGQLHREAIVRGLRWLVHAPEVGRGLIQDSESVIWRKVGRTDPAKLVRRTRAGIGRIHPSLCLRVLDSLFPATRIDFECRPYHLGWILFTWTDQTNS